MSAGQPGAIEREGRTTGARKREVCSVEQWVLEVANG